MFSPHRFQANRYEYKYLIDEDQAPEIRRVLSDYLVPDEYADPARQNSYDIHSLYLDNAAHELCRATLDGARNRYKLRIRFYDESPTTPVFCEIKRRVNDAVAKERVAVRRDAVPRLLLTHAPDRAMLWHDDTRSYETLRRFCEFCDAVGADRGMLVSYRREAYVSPADESVRVTLDREVAGGRFDPALRVEHFQDPLQPRIPGTILEMKFTDRFPNWMRELVLQLNLQRRQMAKYVSCVLSHDRLTAGVLSTEY
ncbi:MAG: polyphosphate polymerase domain-containing protein [Pirellulales bacterium]